MPLHSITRTHNQAAFYSHHISAPVFFLVVTSWTYHTTPSHSEDASLSLSLLILLRPPPTTITWAPRHFLPTYFPVTIFCSLFFYGGLADPYNTTPLRIPIMISGPSVASDFTFVFLYVVVLSTVRHIYTGEGDIPLNMSWN